jgi:hypothetical protein
MLRFMASANVKLVQSIYAAWERGDFSSPDWAHPEIEFLIPEGMSAGRWTGIAGMAKGWGEFLIAWDDSASRRSSTVSLMTSASSFATTTAGAARRGESKSGMRKVPACFRFVMAR